MDIVDEGEYFSGIIESEEDAWEAFHRAQAGEFDEKPLVPEFRGWPDQEIVFWLGDEHEVLTAPMLEALLDYQAGLYRTFLLVEEDTTNLRRLSDEYRRKYEMRFHVGQGCTKLLPDLTGALEKFATTAAANMTGGQLTAVLLGVALIWGSSAAWRAYLDYRAKKAAADATNETTREFLAAQQFASEQDTQRFTALVGALEAAVGSNALTDASEEAKAGVLKAASRMDETEVADVHIDPEAARKMTRRSRSEPRDDIIDGVFRVLRTDSAPEAPFRVKLRNEQSGEEFFAGIRDALIAGDDREIISEAEWTHSRLQARIEAKRSRGEIVEATIVSVRQV